MLKVKSLTGIKYIAVHHVGGLLNNPFYSSLGMKAEDVERGHKERWGFKSEMDRYGGYNAFLDSENLLTQFRLIGEETAAQKGHNFDTISLCLSGNFTIDPTSRRMVDQPIQKEKLGEILDWMVTNLGIKVENIVAHRFLGWTDCYGTGLTNSWAREALFEYRAKREMRQKISALQQLILLYSKLIDLLRASKMRLAARFGSQPLYHIGLCEADRG